MSRAQIASLVASTVDYGAIFILTEFFHVWYVIGTAVGALLGAAVNFVINRHWSFQATRGSWRRQAHRYLWVSAGSLVLNTAGVFLVTEKLGLHYAFSVILVSLVVGVLFNYPLHRCYVYRPED